MRIRLPCFTVAALLLSYWCSEWKVFLIKFQFITLMDRSYKLRPVLVVSQELYKIFQNSFFRKPRNQQLCYLLKCVLRYCSFDQLFCIKSKTRQITLSQKRENFSPPLGRLPPRKLSTGKLPPRKMTLGNCPLEKCQLKHCPSPERLQGKYPPTKTVHMRGYLLRN